MLSSYEFTFVESKRTSNYELDPFWPKSKDLSPIGTEVKSSKELSMLTTFIVFLVIFGCGDAADTLVLALIFTMPCWWYVQCHHPLKIGVPIEVRLVFLKALSTKVLKHPRC